MNIFDKMTFGEFEGEQYSIVANKKKYRKSDMYGLCISYVEAIRGKLTNSQKEKIFELDVKKIYIHRPTAKELEDIGKFAWVKCKKKDIAPIKCWEIDFSNLNFLV